MSIYVKVGDEVVSIPGEDGLEGCVAALPVPAEQVVSRIDRAVERQVVSLREGADGDPVPVVARLTESSSLGRVRRSLAALRAAVNSYSSSVGSETVDPADFAAERVGNATFAGVEFPVAEASASFVVDGPDSLDGVALDFGGAPVTPAFGWRRSASGDRWVQVLDGQMLAELLPEEVAGELNSLVEAAGKLKAIAVDVKQLAHEVLDAADKESFDPAEPGRFERVEEAIRRRSPEPVQTASVTVQQVAGKYVERKPPRVVDAVHWTGSNFDVVSAWLSSRVESSKLDPDDPTVVVLWDEDERQQCRASSWIVQDGTGTTSVWTDERFRKLYAPSLAVPSMVAGPSRAAAVCSDLDVALSAYRSSQELGDAVRGFEAWDLALKDGKVDARRVACNSTIAAVRGAIDAYLRSHPDDRRGDHDPVADAIAFRAAERIEADEAARHVESSKVDAVDAGRLSAMTADGSQFDAFAELVAWRRWARSLLKGDGFDGDDMCRKKIAAVIEAPSAVSVEDVITLDDDQLVMSCCRVAHEVYRAGLEDSEMREWALAPEAERAVVVESVVAAISGTTPEQWHRRWCEKMASDGWKYGPARNEDAKEHPNLVNYESLDGEQRALDRAFIAAVKATAREVSALRDALAPAVLRIKGVPTPEQVASSKHDWSRAAGGLARSTPIMTDSSTVEFIYPVDPPSILAFVDGQIDSMLSVPMMWGEWPYHAVELQVMLLLEVRAFVVGGRSVAEAVVPAYAAFVAAKLGDSATAESLAAQLESRVPLSDGTRTNKSAEPLTRDQLTHEFSALMCEFATAQRMVTGVRPPAELGAELAGPRERERLVRLFEEHCECRPVDTARFIHSHDCGDDTTDDVRMVLHRVVRSALTDEMPHEYRAATDDEVRGARARIAATAIWDGVKRDLRELAMELKPEGTP